MPDQPTDVAALVRVRGARCRRCARRRSTGDCSAATTLGDRGRADYAQNRWAAARFGPRARAAAPGRRPRSCPRRELGARAARARRAGGARARRRRRCSTRIDPAALRGRPAAAERDGRSEAAADLVARTLASLTRVATVTETIQVSGIRCERCVMRLAQTLEGTDGLESANANLMGQVSSPTTTSAPRGMRSSPSGSRRLPRAALASSGSVAAGPVRVAQVGRHAVGIGGVGLPVADRPGLDDRIVLPPSVADAPPAPASRPRARLRSPRSSSPSGSGLDLERAVEPVVQPHRGQIPVAPVDLR